MGGNVPAWVGPLRRLRSCTGPGEIRTKLIRQLEAETPSAVVAGDQFAPNPARKTVDNEDHQDD